MNHVTDRFILTISFKILSFIIFDEITSRI